MLLNGIRKTGIVMSELKWPLMQNNISWQDKWQLVKFILTTNRYTQGEKVQEFEKAWNTWLGSDHSLFVTSGSTANTLLVDACMEKFDIPPGSKVLLPATTWMTNVAPPIQLGLDPVFCDINLTNYGFDPVHAAELAKLHPDIRLIFVSHLLGFYQDFSYLQELFPQAVIIEDICESHGCLTTHGKKSGSKSIGATFSFYFGHHMTSIEGGIVSTADSELYDLMKMKRSHGMARHSKHFYDYKLLYPDIDPAFLFVTMGYNFRNTEIAAVLACSQLKRLDRFIEIRNKNYGEVANIINLYPQLFEPIYFSYQTSSFCFPLVAKNPYIRIEFQRLCKEHGIEYRPIVSGNLLKQPFLKKYNNAHMPQAQNLHELGMYIGNNQFVGTPQVDLLNKIMQQMSKNGLVD
jgi:CDP-6-deoxy-D-xylo-4-hexulose-3-dehydrase